MTATGHIFISYKSQERHFAVLLRDKLKEWGYVTWLDVDHLKPGAYWANDIDQALKTCSACVAVMTPMSITSRYVTNEWDMSIMKGKLFIPLMFELTEPHYKYIDIQYIDFTSKDKEDAFLKLNACLASYTSTPQETIVRDPYHDYLEQLYNRINKYLSAKLISSLHDKEGIPEPIRLSAKRQERAVDVLFEKRDELDPLFTMAGIVEGPLQEFDDFTKAVDYYDGRVLLLGEPGSGKTITLLHYARDAVVKRRQATSAPLPILGIIATWDTEKQPSIAEWLASSYSAPANLKELLDKGQALLLLDGLDELDKKKKAIQEDAKIHPGVAFLKQLPANNRVVLTCRSADYQSLGEKVKLNGAIVLKSLNQAQINTYLHKQPELFVALQNNSSLNSWLQTPLLLSLFAFAYQRMNETQKAELIHLEKYGDLRDMLIRYYIEQRYDHESNKADLGITLEEIKSVLGYHAAKVRLTANGVITIVRDKAQEHRILDLSMKLQYVISYDRKYVNYNIVFVHKFIETYFAYHYLVPLIGISSLHSGDVWIDDPATMLGGIDEPRVPDVLYQKLVNSTLEAGGTKDIIYSLIFLGDKRVFNFLSEKASSKDHQAEVANKYLEEIKTYK